MIGMNDLGPNGRLGNQLFQYAALIGISKNNGYELIIPPSLEENEWKDHFIFKAFGEEIINFFNHKIGFINAPTIIEDEYMYDRPKKHMFNQNLFHSCPDNVNIQGWFQSYKYFENVKNEIRQAFKFKKIIEKPFDKYVAIHVRRGDHLTGYMHHPVLPMDYYDAAMKLFDGYNFVIISDDPEWCKQQDVFKDCYFSKEKDHIDDMNLMSQADHNIIANSTFSWWGAWLNNHKNKRVIVPQTWYGPAYNYQSSDDICPPEWIKLAPESVFNGETPTWNGIDAPKSEKWYHYKY